MNNEIIFKRDWGTVGLGISVGFIAGSFLLGMTFVYFRDSKNIIVILLIIVGSLIAYFIAVFTFVPQHYVYFYEDGISIVRLRNPRRKFLKWNEIQAITSDGRSVYIASKKIKPRFTIYLTQFQEPDKLLEFLASRNLDPDADQLN